MLNVAIQGERGSYSELAAMKYFGKVRTIKCDSFTDAFEAVGKRAKCGFVPIENTIEGIVTQVCDLLLRGDLHILGEEILRIEHCLIVNKGVSIGDIKTVYSHPQALAQSRRFLEGLGVEIIPFSDTAGSVKMLKEKGIMDSAAVASQYAASVYGMKILRRNLETHSHNYTRFLAISKRANGRRIVKPKTSLGFVTRNTPGALYKALGCFADNDVNLTYLQSRPVLGKPWEYGFYAECRGNVKDEGLRNALEELRRNTDEVKVLGSYSAAERTHH
jgi:prephenate dehydratase